MSTTTTSPDNSPAPEPARVAQFTQWRKKLLRYCFVGALLLISAYMGYDVWSKRQAAKAREAQSLTANPFGMDEAAIALPASNNVPSSTDANTGTDTSTSSAVSVAPAGTAIAAALPASSPSTFDAITPKAVDTPVQASSRPIATLGATVGDANVPNKLGTDVGALNNRMDRVEGLLSQVMDTLRSLTDHLFSTKKQTVTTTDTASASAKPVRPAKPVEQAKAKPKQDVAVVAPAAAPAPRPQNELLAVDVWDGVPSAVIGSGVPGDKRVKVLRAGDSDHGVTVKSVDLDGQRATFIISGQEVTLSTTGASR